MGSKQRRKRPPYEEYDEEPKKRFKEPKETEDDRREN
jgi:hypothetical protein